MNYRHKIAAFAGALALVATTTFTGMAATGTTATVGITSNTSDNVLVASITGGSFGTLPYSLGNQTATGSVTVTATDTRGTLAGWHVNLSATNFTSTTSTPITINNLSLTAGSVSGVPILNGPSSTAGVTAASANPVTTAGTTVLTAGSGSGAGQFDLPMSGTLNVPGGTLVGTYTSTVSVAVVSGP